MFEAKLAGRMARCHCGKERPSTEALEGKLAFFEYQGEGSKRAEDTCRHCRYYEVAHGSGAAEDRAKGYRPRRDVVAEGDCPGFESHGPFDKDIYYCGCRGWD